MGLIGIQLYSPPSFALVPSPPSPGLERELPVLKVCYEEIGFERYLDFIDGVERFFVLTETETAPAGRRSFSLCPLVAKSGRSSAW